MTATALTPSTAAARTVTDAVNAVALCKSIDERPVLNGIDLAIPAGQYLAILGINGAGKTTLLKILSTLLPPSSGSVALFGLPLPLKAAGARARLGLVGHQSMLYRDLTARENLELFARLYGVKEPRQRAQDLLITVGMIARADDPVKTFSRGMSQRVSIARALVHSPDLILADEPFEGLDVPGTAAIERLLVDLHAQGKTIVLVNHDVPQSLRLSQRVLVLKGGQISVDQVAHESDAPDVMQQMIPDRTPTTESLNTGSLNTEN